VGYGAVVKPGEITRTSPPAGRAGGAVTRPGGFTLVELMITLVIVATLLGIGVPLFRDFIKDQRARTTSSDLSVALLLARSEAVKRNVRVTLEPRGGDWSTGWTIASPNAGEPDILNHVQPGDIAVTEENGLAQVRFSSAGRALDLAVFEINVDTQTNDRCRQVELELDGRTKVTDDPCGGG